MTRAGGLMFQLCHADSIYIDKGMMQAGEATQHLMG
jgi:hypothetical protein